MFTHHRARRAGLGLRPIANLFRHLRLAVLALAAGFGLQACVSAPAAPGLKPDPSDASARVKPSAYRGVTGGYTSQRPSDPLPWRERNERITPQEKE
jgi:hypothetical protein